ncbi:hypothetical protein [Pseudonocardia sp. TRM90224]|uniref:hypothetical protein n=1 Tax=Pseudonocardia sp. TRM90224 TaxID=2812678 RepID=UPI001E3C2E0C|nr:hypothetical protein [Pseudonocardia sp. TRM90224]
MSHSADEAVAAIMRHLAADGFDCRADGAGRYRIVSQRGDALPAQPVLTIPADLFLEYLQDLAGKLGYPASDPFTEALSLTNINLMEELETTHGLDRNHVTALGYRRVRGRVRFYVEHDFPDGAPAPPTDPDQMWVAERPE